MKNYKVKAVKKFIDSVTEQERIKGDIFTCCEERLEKLLSHNAVELIEVIEFEEAKIETIEEVIEEVKPKKNNKKKSK